MTPEAYRLVDLIRAEYSRPFRRAAWPECLTVAEIAAVNSVAVAFSSLNLSLTSGDITAAARAIEFELAKVAAFHGVTVE